MKVGGRPELRKEMASSYDTWIALLPESSRGPDSQWGIVAAILTALEVALVYWDDLRAQQEKGR